MEILGEFFVTAFVAVIFSFLIAKLVSMAMSGDSGAESESKSGIDVGVETKTRELRSGERLEVKAFESERKVELVEEIVGEADEIEAAPGEVEEIAELDDRCGEFEAELRRLREETEAEVRFDGVVGEESFGGGKGDELGQESASEVEELEDERAQVDEIVESATPSPEMEAIHCEQPENFESEVKFEDITEEKLEKKDAEETVPEKSKSEMNSDDIVEEKVVNKDVEEIDEALETKKDYEAQSDEIGVVDESKLESDNDDDDDWEGIERSELEEDFAVAAKYVEGKGELQGVVGSDVQMEMYGLHKVATEGPCREPQPMALKMNARAKWNAWQRLGNMSPEVAMEQYVALLSDRVPGWMEDNSAGESKQEHAEAGFQATVIPATSTLPDYKTDSTKQRNSESESAAAGDHKSECTTSNKQGNE